MKNNKIIGLIGGMGPFASARFLQILLEKSCSRFGAKDGGDFPEILLDSVPINDFISDPKNIPEAKEILESRIRRLNNFGCTIIAIICNTGHVLFPELSRVSKTKMISIIDTVRDKVLNSKMKKVGLLATKTTIKSGIFENSFAGSGVKLFFFNDVIANDCEKVIRAIIANENTDQLMKNLLPRVIESTKKRQLDGVILGCTELPLVFPKNKKFIDCLDTLADVLLKEQFAQIDLDISKA